MKLTVSFVVAGVYMSKEAIIGNSTIGEGHPTISSKLVSTITGFEIQTAWPAAKSRSERGQVPEAHSEICVPKESSPRCETPWLSLP